jgi:predicted metalloprotease with PDZ domain
MSPRIRVAALAVLLCIAVAPAFAAVDFTVSVDAREVGRGLLHVTQSFPGRSGTVSLTYPRWIPGEHGPTGPTVDVAALVVRAGGKTLAWRRDVVDMQTIRVDVPSGAKSVEVGFDFLLDNSTDGFTSAACATPNLLLLSWNEVSFYPTGQKTDVLRCEASLTLPDHWQYGTALETSSPGGATVKFQPCTFTTLVDSPVLCGRYFKTVELAPGDSVPVRLRMACDSEEGLNIPDSQVQTLRNLAREAKALFGTQHFRHYDFLMTLSEHTAHFGLEHHQSSDDRVRERVWLDDDLRRNASNLLSHEFVHSWNGKFRRPGGLATGDFFTPMQGDLLWVYEGLTQYLGFVLAGRSGIRTPDEARDALASAAADMEAHRGRAWRPLVDTGTEAQFLYEARGAWEYARRSTDFYDEGLLIWLDADVLIRTQSKGQKSLDDFCKRFHGGPNRGPEVKPYTLSDVIAALQATWPYDWAGFLRERVYTVQPHAPVNGITAGGWRMTWKDSLGPIQKAREVANKTVEEPYSLGIRVDDKDAKIIDVVPGSPADEAGLAPDMKLAAVNGRKYSSDVLRDAIAASPRTGRVELLCENKEFFKAYTLDYRDGRRHPALARDNGVRDHLSELLSPHAKQPADARALP